MTNPNLVIEFHKTADATVHAKKLLRDKGFDVWSVNSRYLPDTARFRTTVLLRGEPTNETLSHVVATLHDAGYQDIDVSDALRTVQAFSALTGSTHDPAAELARRALVEQLPESYSADEVSAMSDSEAIQTAVSCELLEG